MIDIACFHLYNDYSGSPKVLRNVLEGLLDRKYSVNVITSDTDGVLDDLKGNEHIKYDYFHYSPTSNKIVWALLLFYAQICMFFKALKYKRCAVFYINTIMPIGAALAGKLLRKRVVYHYHENAFVKSGFYRFLYRIMLLVADEIICVSNHQRSFLPDNQNITVVYNALPVSFTQKLVPDVEKTYRNRNILMVSSLLLYKSPIEFVVLATQLKQYKFTLVLNETQEAIDSFIRKNNIDVPENLHIYPRQSDISIFYNEASILLNLSDRKKIIETFGMTVLEGMSVGLPVIVPTVGGVAELVEDDVNGYKIDVQELNSIAYRIDCMLQDYEVYQRLSKGALSTASLYSSEKMCNEIEKRINKNFK